WKSPSGWRKAASGINWLGNCPALQRSETRLKSRTEGYLYLLGFGLCIPLANWMIGNVGTFCVPEGPCLIPVAPGIMAPSGVLMIGLALVLRDLVQRRLGLRWVTGAIVVGAGLSALVAPPALVVASAAAFLLSEFADLSVYTPLQKRRLVLAVLASSMVGLVVDSVVFLYLAFDSLDFLAGQVLGKGWMVLAALPFIAWLRRRDERLGLHPA
ncbi:MAG TPA: VUT family protein, partial [Thermohalobaculum sp.]|nr:VUT family protein [Thermohalobaculum sp.]